MFHRNCRLLSIGLALGLGLIPAITRAAPLVTVQIFARLDGTDNPFSSTITVSAGQEYDYIVTATLAAPGTVNTNLPVDPGTGLQNINHYVSGAGTTGTVPQTDGLQGIVYSAYEAPSATTQVSFQEGSATGSPLAGYEGAGGDSSIDLNTYSGLNMRRSTGAGSQVNGTSLISGGVGTNLYGFAVNGQQGSATTLKPTSLSSQASGYVVFNNYGAGAGATPGFTANRGNGNSDLVRAVPIGPSGTGGYFGIDPNTGISGQTATNEMPYTVILASGSNLGGPTYGSGGGDANGNDTTFKIASVGAGTSVVNLNIFDMNAGNPGGAFTPTTNILNIEYHNSQGTLVQPGTSGSFQYSAQIGADPVIAYVGLTVIGSVSGNNSVLTFSPTSDSFGNVLLNGTRTNSENINNAGSNPGTYTGVTSNNGISAPASGTANQGPNAISVTLNANANGSGAAGNGSWTYSITNTSAGNTDPGLNQTLTMAAVIANAGADTTNVYTAFGPSFGSTQVAGSSFKGLSSTVVGSSSGPVLGGPLVHSTATIVQGQNNSGGTDNVTMAWRGRTLFETGFGEGGTPTSPPLPPGPHALVSDVVNLSMNAGGPDDATSVFALQMSYENLGNGENLLASKGLIYLAWLNPNGAGVGVPEWTNAVNGNNGTGLNGDVHTDVLSSYAAFALANGITDANVGNFLGSWGVDTTTHNAWAVLNNDAQFAVVPEPTTIALAIGGLVCLMGSRRRLNKA